jgi:hypothetical protein
MRWMMSNSAGKKDAMLTFAFFSFLVVTLNILLSTFGTLTINDFTISFQVLDGSIMAVYLGATFTAYVSRRFTDKVYKEPTAESVVEKKNDLSPQNIPTAPVEYYNDDDDIALEPDPDEEPTLDEK